MCSPIHLGVFSLFFLSQFNEMCRHCHLAHLEQNDSVYGTSLAPPTTLLPAVITAAPSPVTAATKTPGFGAQGSSDITSL